MATSLNLAEHMTANYSSVEKQHNGWEVFMQLQLKIE